MITHNRAFLKRLHINGVYTQHFNRHHKLDGQLFRGRYKAVLIDSDRHLLEVMRYIHRNPLRAGLARDLNDYPWGSHQGYLSQSIPLRSEARTSVFAKKKRLLPNLTCVEENNLEPVLYLLLDPHPSLDVRKRAAELLKELNDLSCIAPLRNHDFKDSYLEQAVNMAISAILANHLMKKCPFCAEIIKARAKLYKHCQKELA